jgi:hypothetical protein
MVVSDAGPGGGARQFKNNGHSHRGTQQHQGQAGGRQCVASAEARLMADEQRTLSAPRLRERISRRGIWRAVGVSLPWRLHVRVERLAACPEH